MYDLYSMPREDFKKLEEIDPGVKDMHPFCLAEQIGGRYCKHKTFVEDNDDEEALVILDSFIGGVAILQNKTVRGIEDGSKYCLVSDMPMDKVRVKTDILSQFDRLKLINSTISFPFLGSGYFGVNRNQPKNMLIL